MPFYKIPQQAVNDPASQHGKQNEKNAAQYCTEGINHVSLPCAFPTDVESKTALLQ
jgi:hypothetical protein